MKTQKRELVESVLTRDFANTLQAGIMAYRYKDIPALKCPFDLAIYTELLHSLRPATVLEFGSKQPGFTDIF